MLNYVKPCLMVLVPSLALSLYALQGEARAECRVLSATPSYTAGQLKDLTCDTSGRTTVTLGTNISGEDASATGGGSTTGVMVTEQRYLDSGLKVTDALVLTGAGYLECIWVSMADAAPTAGTISVNDAVSAGTGTPIFTWVTTTAVFTPFQICPHRVLTTGLYIDFTTTADVNVSTSYRP